MYEFQTDEQNQTGKITLTGNLRIQEITAVKEALAEAVEKVRILKINHTNAKSFDLTYLQLLVSLAKTASAQNKQLIFEDKHPVEFISLIKDSGSPLYGWLNIENEDDSLTGGENG